MNELPNQKTSPFKKTKQKYPFFNTELVAFVSFLGIIGFLLLMARLPGSPKKTLEPPPKIVKPNLVREDPDPEKKEDRPENLPFPEEESEWGPLIKKHLWRVAYSNNSKQIQESKLFLKTVPGETVSDYVQTLLKSATISDRILGAIAVRFIGIPALVSEVVDLVPPLTEEKNVEGVSFYLEALALGTKNEVPLLSSYAFQSRVIRNRLVAFESLAQIKAPEVVPKLCELLMKQTTSTPESVALIQTLIASVQPNQYPLISNLLDSSLSYPKESALFIMRSVDLDAFVQFYEKALQDESMPIRKRAYSCLMELKSQKSLPILLERAKNKELPRWEQILALEAVGRCGAELKPAQLDVFLQHKEPVFRFLVCSILANLKDPQGVSGLIDLLSISENDIEVPQGSDMEEELSWLQEQTLIVLQQVTQKEFPDAVSWSNWWLKQKKSFKFPSFSYMEKLPTLYENR